MGEHQSAEALAAVQELLERQQGDPNFVRHQFNYDYSTKYLPQLASYAYCMENPASAEQIDHYKSGDEKCWPPSDPRYRRVPKDRENPIAHKIGSVGILMFGFENNLELHGNKFHFTCESTWVDVTQAADGKPWEDVIKPLAQNVCDIIAEPDMPDADEKCGNCTSEAEHQALLDG